MAKQIYIDSNGNEVLVSGTITNDNNLPHYTGTPTAGTTAYEIANLFLDNSDTDSLTYTNVNTATFTFTKLYNFIVVSATSTGAMAIPTSWTSIGTLKASMRPSTALSVCLITGDNHNIFLEINTNGTVRTYSPYSGNMYPSGTAIYNK